MEEWVEVADLARRAVHDVNATVLLKRLVEREDLIMGALRRLLLIHPAEKSSLTAVDGSGLMLATVLKKAAGVDGAVCGLLPLSLMHGDMSITRVLVDICAGAAADFRCLLRQFESEHVEVTCGCTLATRDMLLGRVLLIQACLLQMPLRAQVMKEASVVREVVESGFALHDSEVSSALLETMVYLYDIDKCTRQQSLCTRLSTQDQLMHHISQLWYSARCRLDGEGLLSTKILCVSAKAMPYLTGDERKTICQEYIFILETLPDKVVADPVALGLIFDVLLSVSSTGQRTVEPSLAPGLVPHQDPGYKHVFDLLPRLSNCIVSITKRYLTDDDIISVCMRALDDLLYQHPQFGSRHIKQHLANIQEMDTMSCGAFLCLLNTCSDCQRIDDFDDNCQMIFLQYQNIFVRGLLTSLDNNQDRTLTKSLSRIVRECLCSMMRSRVDNNEADMLITNIVTEVFISRIKQDKTWIRAFCMNIENIGRLRWDLNTERAAANVILEWIQESGRQQTYSGEVLVDLCTGMSALACILVHLMSKVGYDELKMILDVIEGLAAPCLKSDETDLVINAVNLLTVASKIICKQAVLRQSQILESNGPIYCYIRDLMTRHDDYVVKMACVDYLCKFIEFGPIDATIANEIRDIAISCVKDDQLRLIGIDLACGILSQEWRLNDGDINQEFTKESTSAKFITHLDLDSLVDSSDPDVRCASAHLMLAIATSLSSSFNTRWQDVISPAYITIFAAETDEDVIDTWLDSLIRIIQYSNGSTVLDTLRQDQTFLSILRGHSDPPVVPLGSWTEKGWEKTKPQNHSWHEAREQLFTILQSH
ncbi:hypothetical protein GNI_060860 [Gregarina niphandrodes]|uniref:Uncharacterized protein n=1 Tax=Gregarina niphandrodes TaxID=110365 RepID=A0A023B8E7_GRENI|nr:hypothetical protein GNI_060860 [Gregarina niphandrodes]EZG68906.1 hypothetical protein GNI_060860 [Gregarina niphandrodes]|eukprot:XP_011134530.1 hypothetical protein GNI_060860 [Gregarina niphandrodes]